MKVKDSLQDYFSALPIDQGKAIITIECICDFEPYGIASEDWDLYWRLTLTNIPYHYKSTDGWHKGTGSSPMVFKDHSIENVILRAKYFMEWYNG